MEKNWKSDSDTSEYLRNFKKRQLENPTEYFTSDYLFDKGMFACCYCGAILSVDNKWCGECKKESIILKE